MANEGRVLRLIATTVLADDGAIEASVVPTAVPADSPFGRCDGVLNRVEVDGLPVGRVAFEGPGAGGPAAGAAVLSDLVAVARGVGSTWAGLAAATEVSGPARPPRRRRMRRRRRPAPATPSATDRHDPAQPRRPPSSSSATASSCPLTDTTPVVSLGEGATPLIPMRRLGASIGVPNLHVKFEGMNPTGSFKDRGMVMAVAKALEEGARSVICASTGNTSASAAAYAAAAGLECVVVLPAGKIALGKLAPGAGLRRASRERRRATSTRRCASSARSSEQDEHPITLVNSVNPFRLEGQKTAAFEICDDLGRAPDVLAIPVGNAGNITAYWRGFREYRDAGRGRRQPPRMLGFQAAGAAPIVLGHPVEQPETIATAIRIGNPASWDQRRRRRATSRAGRSTPSPTTRSSTPTAACSARKACSASRRRPHRSRASSSARRPARSSLTRWWSPSCTGNGLKDPHTAEDGLEVEVTEAEPSLASVARALGW